MNKMIEDLSNNNNKNDDDLKNNILKHYLNKWKDNALGKKNKKRISERKNLGKSKNKYKEPLNKKENKDKRILKKYFNKWRDNALYPDKIITPKKMLHKLINYKKNPNENNKYVKKNLLGNSTAINSFDNLNSKLYNLNNSNLDSSSATLKQYYPSKVNKYNNKYNNNNFVPQKQEGNTFNNTYNPGEDPISNISFGDQLLSNDNTGNLISTRIFDKIKGGTGKNSQNSMISDNSGPNHNNKNLPMNQRIKKIYRSPNESLYSNINNRDTLTSNNKFKKKNKKKNNYGNLKEEDELDKNDQNSDDTSLNNSLMGGIYLQGTKTENLKPITYTSQSFFIDKNTVNSDPSELPNISYYGNLGNKCPMTMKGDFSKLIEKNPEILLQKNPRIQVTNATCDLAQFDERDNFIKSPKNKNINTYNYNRNINGIFDNKINKDEESTMIVNNCDKDIYEAQKPYETQQQKYISVSIPLKNDVAKWEFLNGVKGERYKNNSNKFELIQKDININNNINDNELLEKKTIKSNANKSMSRIFDEPNSSSQYKLREMNYSQFYKSPVRTKNKKEDENILSPSTIRLVKKNKNSPKKKNGPFHSRVSSVDYNSRSSYMRNEFENSYE